MSSLTLVGWFFILFFIMKRPPAQHDSIRQTAQFYFSCLLFFLPFSAGIRGPVCLQTLVRLTCDHVELLLTGEVDKLHGVAETRMVKFWYSSFSGCSMASLSFSTPKTFTFKWCAPCPEVAVHDVHQRVGTLCVVVAECTRVDGLRVGDTVESVLVRQLSHRVE